MSIICWNAELSNILEEKEFKKYNEPINIPTSFCTIKINNISINDFRDFLKFSGCEKIKVQGGHER